MKTFKWLFILFSLLWSAPFYGKGLTAESELSVHRFYGQRNKNSANVGVYRVENGLLIQKQVGVLSLTPLGQNICKSLLAHLQSFSLLVMKDAGYLTDEDVAAQDGLVNNIPAESVTFLEISHPVPRAEVEKNLEKYKLAVRTGKPDSMRPHHVHIRQAAMWVISAQQINPKSETLTHQIKPGPIVNELPWDSDMVKPENKRIRKIRPTIKVDITVMPWQYNKELVASGNIPLSENGTHVILDRKKYPMGWEFGRMAQVEPDQMDTIMRSALSVVEEEIEVSLHGRPEQAFIFAKAMDPLRARLFRSAGFAPLEGACLSDKNCVMVAKYIDLVKRFPPGTQSYKIARIQHYFPNMSLADAGSFLRRINSHYRAEMDFISDHLGLAHNGPIIMHDFSGNAELITRVLAQIYKIDPRKNIDNFVKETRDWFYDFAREDEFLFGQINPKPFIPSFLDNNAIRITNVHPEITMNPNALIVLLLSIDEFILNRYKEFGVTNGVEAMNHNETKIVFQTRSKIIANELRQSSAEELQPVINSEESELPIYTFVFAREDILALKTRYPSLIPKISNDLFRGYWFFRGISAQPLKF